MEKIVTDLRVIEKNEDFVEVSTNADKAIQFAETLEITDDKTFNQANVALASVSERLKNAERIRRFFTDPLNDHVGRINMMFRPAREKYEEAKKVIKEKAVKYHTKKEEEARKKEERVQKDLEKGKIDLEKASEKVEKIKKPEKTAKSEDTGARMTFRIVKKLFITDESKLPRQYLIPDEKKIKKVLDAGVEVPGAELREEKIVSSRVMY